jgi:hypothetical protein
MIGVTAMRLAEIIDSALLGPRPPRLDIGSHRHAEKDFFYA